MSSILREGVEATVREAPPLTILDLKGDLTTFTETSLREAHGKAVEAGAKHILLNFAQVPYINSSGISVIIEFLADARGKDRQILFTGLTPHFQKIFRIMGLTQYGQYVDSEDEARKLASS